MSSLLFIIDMQEGFRRAESEAILPHIIDIAPTYDHVWATVFVNEPNSLFETQLHWTGCQTRAEQTLMPEVQSLISHMWQHTGYTTINNTVLTAMKELQIRTVTLAGIFTDVCIAKAAMDAFDAGMHVSVAEQAVATLYGRPIHAAAIATMAHVLGQAHVIS